MQDFKPYNDYLSMLITELTIAKHRQLIVVQGDATWCYAFANQLSLPNTYVFSSCHQLKNSVFPKHVHQILGQEFQHAIFDGFSGLYADKLAALAGTVKAGGVFILLLPNDPAWVDPALENVTSFGQTITHSFFNERLTTLLESQTHIFKQHITPTTYQTIHPHHALIDFSQQQACIEQIIKTAQGRAHRPLVISADRGRGKSAALGLAAAALKDKKILLCATQVKAVQTTFKHLAEQLNVPLQANCKQLANLSYSAPDNLLNEKPQCDLLFVDEAAAIPVPMLMQILHSYPRIVFASTMVGYEGNGRGYTLRFLHYLRSQFKSLKTINLDAPIRFAKHDPLEYAIRDLLLLDAQYNQVASSLPLQFEQVSKERLIRDEHLLSQVMALLALAHYQTSVSDLRQLLDAPELHLFICRQAENLQAVCLVAIEGGLSQDIAEQVITGERRPQGHLMAQTLTQLTHDTQWLTGHSARVVRIAVAPESHQQGIGSALLDFCQQQLSTCDFFGASFGANASLVRFWKTNGFRLVKLGFNRDKATAEHAALVIKPLKTQSKAVTEQLKEEFKQDLSVQLFGHFNSLPWQLVDELLSGYSTIGCSSEMLNRADRLLNNDVTLFKLQPLLWQLIWHMPISLNLLDQDTKMILIRLVLQQIDVKSVIDEAHFTGKKEFDIRFKKAVHDWYAQFTLLNKSNR